MDLDKKFNEKKLNFLNYYEKGFCFTNNKNFSNYSAKFFKVKKKKTINFYSI